MEPTSASAAPSRGLVIAVLVAIFLGGILGGIAVDRTLLHGRGDHRPPRGMMGGPGGPGDLGGPGGPGGPGRPMDPERRAEMQKHMVERLARELNLTEDQRAKVAEMIPRHMAAFDSLRQSMAPQLKGLLDTLNADMERVLTPEQVDQWRKMRRHGPGMP